MSKNRRGTCRSCPQEDATDKAGSFEQHGKLQLRGVTVGAIIPCFGAHCGASLGHPTNSQKRRSKRKRIRVALAKPKVYLGQ